MNISNAGEINRVTKIRFGVSSTEEKCKKYNWLEPRGIPRKLYTILMLCGGNMFFVFFVIIIPAALVAIEHFFDILPPIKEEVLKQIFEIIGGALFIGVLVFFGAVIIDTRREFKEQGKLKEVWEEILKDITFVFSLALLSLILIALSGLIIFQKFGIPILIATFSLVYYSFYLIIKRLEKSFL